MFLIMKMMKKEIRTLKNEIVKIMEDYESEFGKIWFYTRNVKRE